MLHWSMVVFWLTYFSVALNLLCIRHFFSLEILHSANNTELSIQLFKWLVRFVKIYMGILDSTLMKSKWISNSNCLL